MPPNFPVLEREEPFCSDWTQAITYLREEGEGGVHRSSGSANVHVSCHLPTQSSGHKNSHATRRNLHILGVRVGGRPAIRSECVIGAEAARRRAVRRKQPRLKGRRRRGKDGYQHQIAKKPRGAHRLQAPAHRSGPASLRSPRTRSSNPGAAPRPPRSRSQPPAGSGNPLQPSPGAQSGPAGPRGLPERSGGATPRPISHHLPPEPRFDLNPPRDAPHTRRPGVPRGPDPHPGAGRQWAATTHQQRPSSVGPGAVPLLLLLPLLLRAGAVSGRRETSPPPSPRCPDTRRLRRAAGRAPSPRKVTLSPAPTWLLPPPPLQPSPCRDSPPPESGRRPCSGAARWAAGGAESGAGGLASAGPGRGSARRRSDPSRAARLHCGLTPPPARSAAARTEPAPPAARAQEGRGGGPGAGDT